MSIKQVFNYFLRDMDKNKQANETIKKHVLWSMGAGLVPLPLIDVAAVTAVQIDMIRDLCKLYEVEFSESVTKSILASLAGSTLAKIGASMLKAIPGVGTILGGVSMSVMSGATTYAVGQVFTSHLETSGDLAKFDINTAKQAFEREFEKGKEFVANMQKKKEPEAQSTETEKITTDDVVIKLQRLKELKDAGIITEEEFQEKKKNIIDRF